MEFSVVWKTIDDDPDTRVAVITGAGQASSAGGDPDTVLDQAKDFKQMAEIAKEAAGIVYNIVNCEEVVILAINGVAVGVA
ncbi:hypothetical protein A9W98_01245 [Mycobacterium gordonae]|uniref:Uncharacterized protein n=1 Tax=Mycobacterium gordonae TaxID=1778 RepID=A0A1A6BJE1_MYCGO|nr:enoyl-CoA hydratase-related protein [Mycobacterium gordonae]MBI2698641.1 hypothetical protein [Mycobacterium sp.]OBS02416.1 hypothetical protein A9W98_01245 [Mycobacterium gordonae]